MADISNWKNKNRNILKGVKESVFLPKKILKKIVEFDIEKETKKFINQYFTDEGKLKEKWTKGNISDVDKENIRKSYLFLENVKQAKANAKRILPKVEKEFKKFGLNLTSDQLVQRGISRFDQSDFLRDLRIGHAYRTDDNTIRYRTGRFGAYSKTLRIKRPEDE